jgi:hypothetical protein
MAGHGPAPAEKRRRRNAPERGDWQPTPGSGWQHGDIPRPPAGLLAVSRDAWDTWMRSWWASHWTPDDLPGLRVVVSLYDQVARGEYVRAGELRLQMDNYGITPKGQQDRRWSPPKHEEPAADEAPAALQAYAHLRAL